MVGKPGFRTGKIPQDYHHVSNRQYIVVRTKNSHFLRMRFATLSWIVLLLVAD